jgi:N-acetylglucosamine-6-sulfatase
MDRRRFLTLSGMAAVGSALAGRGSPALARRPNIVFILTDDQPAYTVRYMQGVKNLLSDRGTTFSRGYVSVPFCGPARVSLATGKYTHNHGIENNGTTYQQFLEHGYQMDALWTRLKAAGYKTGHFGKYINGFEGDLAKGIPPGWDRFFALAGETAGNDWYLANDQGTLSRFTDNEEQITAEKADNWIRRVANKPEPFYAAVHFYGPHGPWYPSNRHDHDFDNVHLPKPPSYDEADISDKPAYVRNQDWTNAEEDEARRRYEGMLEELQDVDDGVRRIVRALEETGTLGNTYIFFATDNGYMLGEHRLMAKNVSYEESVQTPFIVRGPGIVAGTTSEAFVSHLDITATVAAVAGSDASGYDGRSLLPLFASEPDSSIGRKRILVESPARGWAMIRESDYVYVEYDTGGRELYDLSADPYELENLLGTNGSGDAGDLPQRLDTLKGCAGGSCRSAEGP